MTLRILVADDEELERRALRHILGQSPGPRGETIEILEAANGLEALDLAAAAAPDLAFLDIRMPGCDGIETARRLRESKPDLPIVFLTAHDSFGYARDALRLHVDDFLLKPASAAEVRASLASALGRKGSRGEDGPGARGILEWLSAEIRAELSEGKVEGEKFWRWLELGGREAEPRAVLAFRVDGDPGETGRFLLRGAAEIAERVFGRHFCLAGASRTEGLCLLAAAPGRDAGGWADDPEAFALDVHRTALSELGARLAMGLASLGPGESRPLREIGRAARRAAAVAGGERPLLRVSVGAEGPGFLAGRSLEGPGARTVSRALELMDARHVEDLSLDLVAREIGVSPSHLSRLLGRSIGLGFADCLARLRVERARALLASDSVSVKEIAAIVGFRDPAYFSRVFRRQVGTSPHEYRLSLIAPDGRP